jgi:hypothetical protein
MRSVSIVSVPPSAIASRPLTARFISTCSIWPGSARTPHGPEWNEVSAAASVSTAGSVRTLGRYTVNAAPAPAELSTWISPPDCLTIPCTVARPSPVPPAFFFVV